MRNRRWAVVRLGYLTPLATYNRKTNAVKAARALANRDGSHLVVFDVGGHPLSPEPPDVTP